MTAKVINLRAARKARDRVLSADAAAANRARFGRTTSERARDAAEAERLAKALDGAKLDD